MCVMVGHFDGEVFRGDGQGGEDVCQGFTFGNPVLFFHGRGSFSEKRFIPFGTDSGEALVVYASFIKILGERFFGGAQFVSDGKACVEFDAFIY